MDKEVFQVLVEKTVADTAELLVKKNAEYAGSDDVLANFKRNAKKNRQTTLECWQVYWSKHVDSINTYMARVKNKATQMALEEVVALSQNTTYPGGGYNHATDPDRFQVRVNDFVPQAISHVDAKLSEPIEGRFDDNINYSILCKAILAELRGK